MLKYLLEFKENIGAEMSFRKDGPQDVSRGWNLTS